MRHQLAALLASLQPKPAHLPTQGRSGEAGCAELALAAASQLLTRPVNAKQSLIARELQRFGTPKQLSHLRLGAEVKQTESS